MLEVTSVAATKKEIVPFVVGAGLSAAGLAALPLSEILLTAGSGLIAFSYGSLLLGWRAGALPVKGGGGPVTPPPPAQPTYSPPTPPQPQPVTTPTPPPQPSMPSAPSTPSGQTPPTPTPPAAAMPSQPSAPAIEQPKPPGRKLPSFKAPHITLPKTVVENRVPIALLTLGLILVVAAVAIYISPAAGLFLGVFIPGVLLFGFGGLLLFLRLYRKEAPVVVELRRFCMHCGFQMSSSDVSCPRCHRQPPSGVDTKVCPNCGAVIPTLAKFCRDCGAGQPAASAAS